MSHNQARQSETYGRKKNEYFQLDPSIGTYHYSDSDFPSEWLEEPREKQKEDEVPPVPLAVAQPELADRPVVPEVRKAAPVATSSQFVAPALQPFHSAPLQARSMAQMSFGTSQGSTVPAAKLFTSSAPQHSRAMYFEENGYEREADASIPGPSSRIQARSMAPTTAALPQQYRDPAGMRAQNMYMAPVHHLAAPRTLSSWTVPGYPEGMIFEENGYETYEDPSVPGPSSRIQARSTAPFTTVPQNRAPMAQVNHFVAPSASSTCTVPGYQYQHSQYGNTPGMRPQYTPKNQDRSAERPMDWDMPSQPNSYEFEYDDEGAAPCAPLHETKAPQYAALSKKASKKKAKDPNNSMNALLPEDQVLDTSDICKRVSFEIKNHSIPQAVFAKEILGRSQGTLSDLLRNPKPWHEMKSGREAFKRMYLWLEMPEQQRLAMVTKEKATPVAPIEKKALKQRVKFLEYQKQGLEGHFIQNTRPSPETMKELAEQLSLKYETVQNFFTNARRNEKRRKLMEGQKENVEEQEVMEYDNWNLDN